MGPREGFQEQAAAAGGVVVVVVVVVAASGRNHIWFGGPSRSSRSSADLWLNTRLANVLVEVENIFAKQCRAV